MSSASRRSRSHSTLASPTNPSSKRSFSAATSPRAMVNRGKRARRDSSSSPRPPSIIIPVGPSSSVPFSGPSTTNPLAAIPINLASSAPPTPLFPSTSAAFFPSNRPSDLQIQRDISMQVAPIDSSGANTNPNDLYREAFTNLRQSVAESGEGFIRRMREWEQRRHAESSKSSILGNDREREKRRDRGRGRKGRTVRSLNSHAESRRFPSHRYLQEGNERVEGCVSSSGGQEGTDDEDDILLDSSAQIAFGVEQRQRKRRSVSLGDPMDVTDSPDLFNVEIADSDEELYPTSRFTATLGFPLTYSNTRSSSPFSFINTSDDESSYAHTNSGFSSPRGIHKSVDYCRNASSPHSHPGFRGLHLPEGADYDSPDNSPLSTSPRSSNPRFPLASRAPTISQLIPASTPRPLHTRNSPQTVSEKAVAALALALANGSGSLADYGSVREAQGDLEELEAGALWD